MFSKFDLWTNLIDVLGSGPGEAAGVVAADDVKRRVVAVGAVHRKDHRHQRLLLRRDVVGRLFGDALGCVEQNKCRRI